MYSISLSAASGTEMIGEISEVKTADALESEGPNPKVLELIAWAAKSERSFTAKIRRTSTARARHFRKTGRFEAVASLSSGLPF